MVIGELEYKIDKQSKEIKKLKKENDKLKALNNDLQQDNRVYYDTLTELLSNEINIKELQTIYNNIGNVLIQGAKGQDITSQIRQIKDNANNNKLFNIASFLYEYKPY